MNIILGLITGTMLGFLIARKELSPKEFIKIEIRSKEEK